VLSFGRPHLDALQCLNELRLLVLAQRRIASTITVILQLVLAKRRFARVMFPCPQLARVRHSVAAVATLCDAAHAHAPERLDRHWQAFLLNVRVLPELFTLTPRVHQPILRQREHMAAPNRGAAHPNAPQRLEARRRGLVLRVAVAQTPEITAPPAKELPVFADGEGRAPTGTHAAQAHPLEPLDEDRPQRIVFH
jgi:hypothetical protein